MVGDDIDASIIGLLDDPAKRTMAASVLARRGTTSAVPRLIELLAGPDADGRPEIWAALGGLTREVHAEVFVPIVFQAEGAEQRMAFGALRNLVMRSAPGTVVIGQVIPHFTAATDGTKVFILDLAAAAATRDSLALVVGALQDTALRERAIRSLSAWRTADSVTPLLEVAASSDFDERMRLSALRGALQGVSKPGMRPPQRAAMLVEAASLISRPEEKRMLLGHVRSTRDSRLAPVIENWLDDADVRAEAELAAWELVWHLRGNDAESLRTLANKMLQSPNEETVKRAQQVRRHWKIDNGTP
jgi:hypothetical protein